MNEKEILKQITNDLNVGEFYGITEDAIKGLLNLYNNEKGRTMMLAVVLDKQESKIKSLEQELEIQNGCSISKDKIRDLQLQREFELQQQYIDFEYDKEWQIYEKLLKEVNKYEKSIN